MEETNAASKPIKKNFQCSHPSQSDIIYPEEFQMAAIARIVRLFENHGRSLKVKIILKTQRFLKPNTNFQSSSFHRELFHLKENGGS